VGEDGGAARVGHQPDGVARAEGLVRDVRGRAVGEEAVERVLAVARVPGGHEGVGHVGPADGPARPGGDVGERDRDAHRHEPADDPGGPVRAGRAQLGQAGGDRLGRHVGEVGEQVQRARGRAHRHLDPRDHPDAEGGARLERLGNAVEGVVVGDREDAHPRRRRQRHQRRGRQ
jgi:hypothetical protein